jgi:hypothetical protein
VNNKSRMAALEIQLLVEKYSAEELAQALAIIGAHEGEDLESFIARVASPSIRPGVPSTRGRSGLSTRGRTSALQQLRNSAPEKYRVLSEFESRIREGGILATLDEFREFGKVLGKDFGPVKSRKQALGQVMRLLAQLEFPAIEAAIAKAPRGPSRSEGGYGRLANHLISGARPPKR